MEFKRIDDDNNVYCFGCNEYIKPDNMGKTHTQGKVVFNRLCLECGVIKRQKAKTDRLKAHPAKRKQTTDDGYHKLFWHIEETPEIWDGVRALLTRIGYDTSKNIHEQFLIKHNLKK
jgi:hypothetical protein